MCTATLICVFWPIFLVWFRIQTDQCLKNTVFFSSFEIIPDIAVVGLKLSGPRLVKLMRGRLLPLCSVADPDPHRTVSWEATFFRICLEDPNPVGKNKGNANKNFNSYKNHDFLASTVELIMFALVVPVVKIISKHLNSSSDLFSYFFCWKFLPSIRIRIMEDLLYLNPYGVWWGSRIRIQNTTYADLQNCFHCQFSGANHCNGCYQRCPGYCYIIAVPVYTGI